MTHFPMPKATFAAIDFETADKGRDSACSVAIVRVENGRIVARETRLICPPRPDIEFEYIHGLSWATLRTAPKFGQVWREVRHLTEDVDFLAAHYARFDREVLEACCRGARLRVPQVPWVCTVQLARSTWSVFPTKLPDVCRHLGIALQHHDAASDAHACARIVIAASRAGSSLPERPLALV